MSTDTISETDRMDSHSTETDEPPTRPSSSRDELGPEAKRLAEENQRLRNEYARARQTAYRRTALWLVLIGLVAVGGGLLFSNGRQILFALGGTGLFGGLLTYYLTPSRFVPADVGRQVYTASATNMTALADELALRDEYLYLPGSDSTPPRLFVPQQTEYDLPDPQAGPIVTSAPDRGLVLEPTGRSLLEEVERALDGPLPAEPTAIATQLADGIVTQLSLANRATPEIDPDGGRATVAIESSTFGDVDQFDHPVASFLAVGFAKGLDRPVELQVDAGSAGSEWLVTCRWEPR